MKLFSTKTSILKLALSVFVAITIVNVVLFGTLGSKPPAVEAATTNTSDVQYSTTLDWSPTNVLISEGGFTASTTYNCSLATNACGAVSKSITSLVPTALAGQTSYFLSPDNSEAIITTYNPGANPTVKLYSIVNNTLQVKATLPSLNSLITKVLWPSSGTTFILEESDGSMQKFSTATNSLTTFTSKVPAGASWVNVSPDGNYIAYFIPNTVTSLTREYGVIDTTADKMYTIDEPEKYWDLISEGVRVFAFSPDSSKLLYLDDRNGYETLYEINLATLSGTSPSTTAATTAFDGTQITTKPYSIEDMQWVDNSNIVMSANRSNPMIWSLYSLNLNTYAITKIIDNVSYDAPMEKLGTTNILFNTADANGRLPKIYNTITKKVSSLNIPGVSDSIVGTNNQIITTNGLYGVYMKPSTPTGTAAAATSTLLVWLHGGPDRQDTTDYNSYMSYGGYDWVLNQVNNDGVPVLKLDYPGSLGYGTQFAQSIIGGVGTYDASTTMQAISEFASAHGYSNVYVMGNSYGGYLALKLLTAYPSKIAGAFSLSGVTDWQSLLTNVPSSIFSIDFNGAPNATNQALYNNASIINNVNTIGNQKVILIQGDADDEVPYSQSTIMNAALVSAGKDVEYTTLPGENHIYENPASYTLVCNKALELVGLPTSSLCTMK
jgi:predicted esterase